ncbi:MAG: lysophospholipid acyltransferase family protein [Polyangiales bacterium]
MAPLPPPRAKVPPLAADLAHTALGRLFTEAPIRYFHATIEGLEHLPKTGGALIVGNHALLGLDGWVLGALIVRETGRYPRFLGDRNLFRVPLLGAALTAVGAVAGEPQRAQQLLEDGELVIVYPGGVDDSFKSAAQRHRLQWGRRAGFAKVAMRARVPIVPVAGLGIDDMYEVVGREPVVGRALFGSARYDLPIAFGAFGTPLPRRAPQHYVVLPPVDTHGDPERSEELERVRAATFASIDARLASARVASPPGAGPAKT